MIECLMDSQQKKISQRARNQLMDFKVSHKPARFDLMQNCDLPPPSKVFLGPDKSVVLSMNRVCNLSGKQDKEEERDRKHYDTYRLVNGDDEKNKMELLKALEASQTRARESEKTAAILRKEKDGLSIALLEEAMQLFACRQQVRLLELQVLKLQQSLWLQQQAISMSGYCARSTEEAVGLPNEEGNHEKNTNVTWVLALIFSLGIGVATAFALGY